MLHEFIAEHRDELISRARAKVAARPVPRSTSAELEYGVPLFLTHLGELLRGSSVNDPTMTGAAALNGADMLRSGYTIAQVVHDYGDVCQSITEVALERRSPIGNDDFRRLNGCVDDAVAAAVTEFLRLRERTLGDHELERLAALAHEQRNLLSAAMVSFQILRGGTVAIGGSTGTVLGRALMGLRDVIDRSLAEVRLGAGIHQRGRIVLCGFIEDMEATAGLEATMRGIHFTVEAPPPEAAVDADRLLLASAVSNLLSNAFKFTVAKGHVTLRTNVIDGQVRIEVEDQCGGWPPGASEAMFQRFKRRSADRTGLGIGLAIARQGVVASGGTLEVQDLPGKGCIFSIVLPLARA